MLIVRALGLVTVQDLGRPGRMHEAIPPGGALVPELLVAANRTAHNPDGAAAIEVIGRLVVRAEQPIAIATDRLAAHTLVGELTIDSEPRRVTYLAVRGGVAAPLVLGGRGALLCAGLGGLVRVGDRITAAEAALVDASIAPLADGPIRLIAGPDRAAFADDALATLVAAPYTISPSSDRTGTRLVGAALPRRADYQEVSRPMVIGALEVPRDGHPIVLGPEHPTTGGYPVIAVIAAADRGRFFATRIGGSVRFTYRR